MNAFPRTDPSVLGLWWWTVDRWTVAALVIMVSMGVILAMAARPAVAEHLGLDLEEGSAGGGSDGNTTSQYTATLDGLGAVGDGAHAAHEFIYPGRMAERAALLALLLLVPFESTSQ